MKDASVDDILKHYGTKGMRWGVRRKVGSNGRVVGRVPKKKSSVDYKTTKELRKRPSHTLTNMQLKKVNERMQLESKFSQLNPSRAAKGHAAIKGLIAVAGTATAVSNLAKSPVGKSAMNLGKKAVTSSTSRSSAEYASLLRKV